MEKSKIFLSQSQTEKPGNIVRADMFGTNFLFDRDGEENGQNVSQSYDCFIQDAQVTTLRYPGGTMAEAYFDLNNPESSAQNFLSAPNRTMTTLSLSAFLGYAEVGGQSATIVIPTYRFLEQQVDASGHRECSTLDETTLRNFLKDYLTLSYQSGVSIKAFELGNEWYVDNTDLFGFVMSQIEYGRVAAYLATIVQEEIDNFKDGHEISNGWVEPDIAVQVGPKGDAEWFTPEGFRPSANYSGPLIQATELIFDQFDTKASRSAVDAIIAHRYLSGSDNLINGSAFSSFDTWSRLASQSTDFKVAGRYVIEWNVAARNASEIGLRQVDSMILLFAEMVQAGVEHANIWAVQQGNPTRLIENTGKGNDPYGGLAFGGVAFDLLSNQLRDQRLIASQVNSKNIETVAYGSSEKTVIFLMNKSGKNLHEKISFGEICLKFHHGMIVEVSAAGISDVDPLGRPDVTVSTDQSKFVNGSVFLDFDKDETIMLVFSKNKAGVYIENFDENFQAQNQQIGSMFNDNFEGSIHDDVVNCRFGNDLAYGKEGNDFLDAGAGRDTLFGGAGDDTLAGDGQADRLYGDEGDDLFVVKNSGDHVIGEVLVGGDGVDELRFTGSAAQTFVLGLGVDVERVVIGKGHAKIVEQFGRSAINIDALNLKQSVEIVGNNGHNILTGSDFNDTLVGRFGDDTIYGSDGDDFLIGGMGGNVLFGGNGADVFCITISKAGSKNIDAILDFEAGFDQIFLSSNLEGNAKSSGKFYVNSVGAEWHPTLNDFSDYFSYDQRSGALFYDADGIGHLDATQIAQLVPMTALLASDVFIL